MPSGSATSRLRAPSSRHVVVALVACLLAFTTGVPGRPAGDGWALGYDLVLYNVVYLLGSVVCWQAARRVHAERLAWRAMSVGLLANVLGNVVYTLVIARMDDEPFPSVADTFYLAAYPAMYVAIIALIRNRAPRFQASMWLDGLVGGFGAAAVTIAVFLRPALEITAGDPAAVAVNLAFPVADVLLLALLVAVASMLGLRSEPTLLLIAGGLGCFLVSDIVFLDLVAQDLYVEGGPLDLGWLIGVAALAGAAHRTRGTTSAPARSGHRPLRTGWHVIAVPLGCNVVSLVLLAVGWVTSFPPAAAWCAVVCIIAGLGRTAATLYEVRSYNEAREQARTDELTGLPNRRALLERARTVVDDAVDVGPVALLLLDLDGFKEVNDSLGHHAGDELLRLIGPRLQRATRGGDLLARLGGDEFAVLLPDTGLVPAEHIARTMHDVLREPFSVGGIRLHIGVSIGVASAPVPAATVSELLRYADVAMYAAKTSRAGVHVYVPDSVGSAFDRLHTMEELRTAIASDQLAVHLQPQVALADGHVVGVEALVRWNHPTRGLVMPADLLPAAEQAGLLQPLADTVLALALTAAAGWWHEDPVPVSVNLSAANVTDLDLPVKVAAALLRAGLPPQALVLELVEDTLMNNPLRARDVLTQLRSLGVRTSIDDYGSGYSSLGYLHRLPADELKLDRSLTADVAADPRAAAIVRHTVALAHDLGLRLVAEGVEDLPMARALADLGCDVAQGYGVARPMPVGDFLRWLRRHEGGFDLASVHPGPGAAGFGVALTSGRFRG
jgi:diguanylate cyclase (GGDEF)-like protein